MKKIICVCVISAGAFSLVACLDNSGLTAPYDAGVRQAAETRKSDSIDDPRSADSDSLPSVSGPDVIALGADAHPDSAPDSADGVVIALDSVAAGIDFAPDAVPDAGTDGRAETFADLADADEAIPEDVEPDAKPDTADVRRDTSRERAPEARRDLPAERGGSRPGSNE